MVTTDVASATLLRELRTVGRRVHACPTKVLSGFGSR